MFSQFSICHIQSFTRCFASCSLYTRRRTQLAKTPPTAVGACDNQQATRGNLSRSNLKPRSDTLLFSGGTAPFENGVICYTVPVAPLSCPAVWDISALNVANCDCCALTLHDITDIRSWANPSGATVQIDIWLHKLQFLAWKIDCRSCFCGLGKAPGQQLGFVCLA